MSARVDPNFLTELKKYGEVKIESCFNCGNCTAICPLSTEEDNFPRKMNRFAQLGLRDRLLASKELWLCYHCGECTTTCPRQADPGEYMAAARRYAVASYDPTGLAKLLYTSPVFSVFFLLLLAAGIGAFFLSMSGPMSTEGLRLFEFIPSELIHTAGIAAGIFIVLAALAGMVSMANRTFKALGYPKGTRLDWVGAAWKAFGNEVLGQLRYRKDCETAADGRPWYSQKWFIHASMLWGFLGLFLATALNYLLELLSVKATGTWVPLWYPIRALGTLSGIFLLYGATLAIIRRFRKDEPAYLKSTVSDWAFLILMWLSGLTGFILEVAVYLPQAYVWSYWALLAHLIVVGELLLLAPFTKFAHAIYRSIALYLWALKPLPEKEGAAAPAAAD
jgi:ferredoxin